MTGTSGDGSVSVHLTALDVPVALQLGGEGSQELREAIRTAWARCVTGASTSQAIALEVVLDDDPAVVGAAQARGGLAGHTLDHLMDALAPAVTMRAITKQAGNLLMLHACGIADVRTGRTVALVGPSGRGKTTASRALTADPALTYVTDETVGIYDDGRIAAYPKPLSVRVPNVLYKEQISPDALALGVAPAGCCLAGILLLERDPAGPETPEVEPLTTVRALAALAPETSYLSMLPRPLHRFAAVVDSVGGAKTVRYREGASLLALVRSMVGDA